MEEIRNNIKKEYKVEIGESGLLLCLQTIEKISGDTKISEGSRFIYRNKETHKIVSSIGEIRKEDIGVAIVILKHAEQDIETPAEDLL